MKEDKWERRAFVIGHNYNVKPLLLAYSLILVQAVSLAWDKIEWKEKKVKNSYKIPFKDENEKNKIVRMLRMEKRNLKFSVGKGWVEVYYEARRLMPKVPPLRKFEKAVRSQLMEEWRKQTSFAAHYVDSAIRQAHSIIDSWRKNYRKGRAGKGRPAIRRRFVRIKETLFTYEKGTIKITVVPNKKYLDFKIPGWVMSRIRKFLGRMPGKVDFGELILKEDKLIVVVRKPKKGFGRKIAVDTNMDTIDGFDPANGFFTKDISSLRRIAEAYDEQITRLQSYMRKKPSLKKKREKLLRRRNHKVDNEAHLKANELIGEYKSCLFVFEELDKQEMFRDSFNRKRAIELVREIKIVKTDWSKAREIIEELKEKKPNRRKVEELNRLLAKIYSPSIKKLLKKYNREAYEKYRKLWKLSFKLKRCWNHYSRKLHQTIWRKLHKTVEYKAGAEYVPPYNTTKACPRCGGEVELRNGQAICNCRRIGVEKPFILDRHHSASLNIYFASWGFPPGPSTFYRFLIREGACRRLTGSGVTLSGCKPHDIPSMNPERGERGNAHQEPVCGQNSQRVNPK